jgi:hypothetical protein
MKFQVNNDNDTEINIFDKINEAIAVQKSTVADYIDIVTDGYIMFWRDKQGLKIWSGYVNNDELIENGHWIYMDGTKV